MTIWAYLIATISIIFGLYLALRPKQKKIKYGFWCIVFSLAVFISGNLTINNLLPITESFNYSKQIQGLSNQLSNVSNKFQANQAQWQTQSVSITNIINNITMVQKEVADTKSILTNLYAHTCIEQIKPTDAKKAHFVPDIAIPDEYGLLLLLLQQPIPNSVSVSLISDQESLILPPVLYTVFKNMIAFSGTGTPTNYKNATFVVSYVPNPFCATNDVLILSNSHQPSAKKPYKKKKLIFEGRSITPLNILDLTPKE